MRERNNDLIWRINFRGEPLYIICLIEFQSSVDHYMAVRILTYMGLIYQDLIRTKKIRPKEKLPPVFPLVFYTGERKWLAPLDLKTCLNPAIGKGLMKYQPQVEYMLLDIGRISVEDYEGMEDNLVLSLIEIEQSSQLSNFNNAIKKYNYLLKGEQFNGLRRDPLAYILKAGRIHQRFPGVEISDLQELNGMLWERLDRRDEELRQEGRRESYQRILKKLLAKKPQAIPASMIEKFETATDEELDQMLDVIIDEEFEIQI